MKKKIFRNIALALSCTVVLGACQKEYKQEHLPNYEMSGEWFVQTYYGGTDASNVVLGYQKIVTSNTAKADGSELLIDDLGNIWPFKVKANVGSNKTFSVAGSENLYWPEFDTTQQNVTITNGKILTDKGHSASGIVVDSIYFEAEFTDDPGNVYIMAGHYRTGFPEDEL